MIKSWMKNVDMDQMRDQVADLREQLQDIRFRKPWTTGNDSSPVLFMALGAALAWAGMAIYRNREEVASFCSNCGAKLMHSWEQSGLKQKAEKAMNRSKDGFRETTPAGSGMA